MGSQRRNIESAVDLALGGATIITANTRAARSLRREVENRAFTKADVCESPDILPLDAWVSRTWTECLLARVAERALLQPTVLAALWEQIVANSPAGRDLLSARAAADLAAQAWQLLRSYKLPRSRAQFQSTSESSAFYGWAEAFDRRCREEGWIDGAAAVEFLVAHAAKLPKPAKQIAIFAFDQFSPLQSDLWNALRAAGTQIRELTLDVAGFPASAGSTCLSDSREEIRSAALWSRRKLELNPHVRIGIILPGLESVRDTIETIFSECLHPEHSVLGKAEGTRSYDISLGRPLGTHALIRTAFRLLRLSLGEVAATEFTSLLTSRYLSAATTEANGRARLDYQIRKQRKPFLTIAYALSEPVRRYQSLAPEFFRLLYGVDRVARKLPARMTRGDWAVEVRRLLNAAGWPGDGSEEMILTSEEFQVTNAWDSLLTSFGALDQVLPPGAPIDLLRELERSSSDATFAVENTAAQIQIVGPMAASGESFDALWFCGLTDETWPQRGQPNPFIPHSLQVGLPHSSAEVNLLAAERVTERLLQSADDCILSWPAREEDRALRPSPLLAGIKTIASGDLPLAAITSWNERQQSVKLETVVDEAAPALNSEDLRTHGTSLLLWQSGCPFRAFAQARLSAELPRQASLGADSIDRGNVTERALQYVWEQLRGSQDMQAIPADRIRIEIAACVERAVNEAFPKGDEEWLQQHRKLEVARLTNLLREWLDVERRRADFHNIKHQQDVSVNIGGLELTGRADRIEQTSDGAYVVIDYKTGGGAYAPSWWDIPRPQDPQLPIYAVAQRMQGHDVAGVAFAVLRTGKCDFKGESARKEIFGETKNYKRHGEFDQTLESWQPELERLASNFLAGNAEVDPHFPPTSGKNSCRLCHLGSLCRIAEIKATEDDDLPPEIVDEE